MLTHLHIKNFALVEQLDIELCMGLTAITGETGAGKSIMLDALGLALGDRADGGKVRQSCERAEISASFDIHSLPFAQQWLAAQDLDESDDCLLRRVITKEGRSRAYINGQTVTLQQLKHFGDQLIDIHSQHEHQSLMRSQTHRRLLDDFGGLQKLAAEVKDAFVVWQSVNEQLREVREREDELNSRFQLLSYQVDELEQLDVQAGELEKLEQEQRLLANAEGTQRSCQNILDICDSEGVGLRDRLGQALRLLHELGDKPKALQDVESLLVSADINIKEAQGDIARFLDSSELDPSRLHEVEQRLNTIYEVARKHRIAPEAIVSVHSELARELSELQSGEALVEKLEKALAQKRSDYDSAANALTEKRRKSASKLATAVNKKFSELAMENAKLHIQLTPLAGAPSAQGNEKIEFLISTNPGQSPQPLTKVASGGELSRISLAIQVITAQTSTTPVLVFDEVDVGIGGTTGDVVGVMLRELGEQGQVFCVTHLAQVASKAHNHYRVDKQVTKKAAYSKLTVLDEEEKVLEIARMMGGAIDSEQSLAHAREMLTAEQDK